MSKNKMDILIHKIFRFLTNKEKKYIRRKIICLQDEKETIASSKGEDHNNLNEMMSDFIDDLSYFINDKINEKEIVPNDNRQKFITEKIFDYLILNNDIKNMKTSTIIDIGGGNGNVLSKLKNKIEIQNNSQDMNFICLETETDWFEKYNYDNHNIIYKFWDNHRFPIEDKSVDIVFCMVALHHMNDETLNNVFNETYRILKDGGYFIIKEHDANSESLPYVEWEHHLYHVLDCGYNDQLVDTKTYFNQIITNYNFKEKEEWEKMITSSNFQLKSRLNRFLDKPFKKEDKNPSNLYWDIYFKPT